MKKKNVQHRGMSLIDKLSQECVPIPPQYASRIRWEEWEVSAVLITVQDNIRVKAGPTPTRLASLLFSL